MNRILFEKDEIQGDLVTVSDARAEHILRVLHGEKDMTLKTGEVGGLIGTGEIVDLDETSRRVTLRVVHDASSRPPWVDLILAPPRPRVMKRLLPQLATMGVGSIILVGAKKVEKDFWGATLLKEENYRPLLVDGLMQGAVSTALPTIETRRNFRRFVSDELDARFPTLRRIVAHPYDESGKGKSEKARTSPEGRLLLAIGPEGGWTDDEVNLLSEKGFLKFSLGPRILRTDTATIALLSRLSDLDNMV